MIKLYTKTSCPKTCYYAAKVQSFVFIHNVSLCETAKMCGGAVISRYSKLVYIIMFRISRYALAHSFAQKHRFHRSRSPLRSLFNLCF